jgi:hypothetical protein
VAASVMALTPRMTMPPMPVVPIAMTAPVTMTPMAMSTVMPPPPAPMVHVSAMPIAVAPPAAVACFLNDGGLIDLQRKDAAGKLCSTGA